WAHYRGLYHYGGQVILSYTVGLASVLEMPAYELLAAGKEAGESVVFTRTLNIGRSTQDLLLRVAPLRTSVAVVSAGNVDLAEKNGYTLLQIPAAATPVAVKLLLSDGDGDAL